MKVLVIGSNGGSGRAAVEHLLAGGHVVTAFSRRSGAMDSLERMRTVTGDAMNAEDVERAVQGQDAVVVTLGISENPVRVQLFGPRHTRIDVRSTGTRNVIAAMRKHGVRKLVVQTSYGVGPTRDRLRWIDRLFFKLILAPQIDDTEEQNQDVSESGLDWVIVQPVHLTDDAADDMPFISSEGETGRLSVSRPSVGRFLAQAAESPRFVGKTIALSGRRARSRERVPSTS